MNHRRTSNNPSALPTDMPSLEDDFEALDALPVSIRRTICENVTKLVCPSVLAYLRSIERQARERGGSDYDAEVWTLRKLRTLEGQEMDIWASQHRQTYGVAYPHEAADATVQRYGRTEPEIRAMIREAA